MRELPPYAIRQAVFGSRTDPATRAAFCRLYTTYRNRVKRAVSFVARKHGRTADTDEACQAIWCRLLDNDCRTLRNFDHKRNNGKFGPFITAVAFNESRAYFRSAAARNLAEGEEPFFGEDLEAPMDLVAQIVQSDLFNRLIGSARSALSPEDFMLLERHHLGGEKLRHIAQQLGVKEGSLQQRNARLKKKLRKIAEQLLAMPDVNPPPPLATAMELLMFIMLGNI